MPGASGKIRFKGVRTGFRKRYDSAGNLIEHTEAMEIIFDQGDNAPPVPDPTDPIATFIHEENKNIKRLEAKPKKQTEGQTDEALQEEGK